MGGTHYVAGMGRVLILDASHAVELYRIHVYDPVASLLFRQTVQSELRGKDLFCFCSLDKPCHADVLLELANA